VRGGCRPVVTWPLAPNPPCKQMLAAVGVVCWALVPSFSSLALSLWPRRRCEPPYEQMLVGMGQVRPLTRLPHFAAGVGGIIPRFPHPSSASQSSLCTRTPYPPCEQLLAAVVVVLLAALLVAVGPGPCWWHWCSWAWGRVLCPHRAW
jgi:hypothetical protein